MCLGELALQNIIDDGTEIFRGGHGICEFRTRIKVLQIESGDDGTVYALVQIDEIADHSVLVYLASDGDFENVVMPVAIGVVALAVGCAVLFLGHPLAVQAMGCGEAEAAGEMGFHFLLIGFL